MTMEKYKEDAKSFAKHIKQDAEKAIDKTKQGLSNLEKAMKK